MTPPIKGGLVLLGIGLGVIIVYWGLFLISGWVKWLDWLPFPEFGPIEMLKVLLLLWGCLMLLTTLFVGASVILTGEVPWHH